MTPDQIFNDLKIIVAKLLKRSPKEIDEITSLDSRLKDDLGIDSVESLDLLHALESFYSIEISDEEAADLEKVSDVINLLIGKNESRRE